MLRGIPICAVWGPIAIAAGLSGCQASPPLPPIAVTSQNPSPSEVSRLTAKGGTAMSLTLTSPSFQEGTEIPSRFTCDGQDQSPDLAWSGVPDGTKSLALIELDPDAPGGTWVHWVAYNLPINSQGLPAGASKQMPAGTKSGQNGWDRADYGGPCPPSGRHRYVHTLYALDTVLPDLGTPTKATLEKAMHGHVLAHASLTGTYRRAR